MANFNSLQIAKAIVADNRISVSKGFLGFSTKVVYNPTGSIVKAYKKQYGVADGEKIQKLLALPVSQIKDKELKHFAAIDLGNYLLEELVDADRQFAALRLYRYEQLHYAPVTDLLVYEGEEAAIIASLF